MMSTRRYFRDILLPRILSLDPTGLLLSSVPRDFPHLLRASGHQHEATIRLCSIAFSGIPARSSMRDMAHHSPYVLAYPYGT